MTVAELGLKIQSGDATVASRNLEAMTRAGSQAEQQFRTLEATARRSMMTVGQTVNGPLKSVNDNLRAIAGAGGGRGPFDAILAGLTALPIPASAVTVALGAASTAAGVLVAKLLDSGPSVDSTLEEHGRLVRVVKDAYRDAGQEAGEFLKQTREITLLQSQQNLLALQGQIRTQARSFAGSVATTRNNGLSDMGGIPDGTPMAMQGGSDAVARFREFQEPIQRFIATMEAGTPQVEEFRQAVANIGLASPALAANANELLKNSEGLGDLAFNGKQAEASIRLLTGAATEADRKLLGLKVTKTALTKATTEARDAYDRMLETIEKRNEKAQIELDTLGMTAGAAAAYRVEQELLNAAKRAELELTPQQIENNKALAESAARIAERLEQARGPLASYIRESSDLNKGLQTVAVDGLRGVENALVDITKGTTTASEAFKKMTASILEDLGRMLIRAAVARAAGLFLGGGGGVSTYSGSGNPWAAGGMVASANGNVFMGGNLIPFARGGVVSVPTLFPMANGMGLMGEAGPEAIMPLRRGADGRLGVAAPGAAGGVVLNYSPTIDARGADAAAVARLERGQREMAANFEAKVVAVVRDSRSRRVL